MILRTLAAHYLRHPMQALFLLTGIVIANVLLVGTQLINAQARSSYDQGKQLLGVGPVGRIVSVDNTSYLDERLYVSLRRQGFPQLAPVLRQVLRTESDQVVELVGIDALSMPRPEPSAAGSRSAATDTMTRMGFGGLAFPPYQTLAATARIKQLGAESGDQLKLMNGRALPPLVAVEGESLGHQMLIDLGALQIATDTPGQLTAILVFDSSPEALETLKAALPAHAVFKPENEAIDPTQLTQSFHLNLAAMGLLACVVGLFLTYNAIAFSYTDRRELLRRLRLSGVSQRELAFALGLELSLFLAIGTLVGVWLGALLAARLLPGVGQTLAQLFDVYIAYPDTLVTQGYLLPILISAAAATLCALFPLREALKAPLLTRHATGWHIGSVADRDRKLAVIGVMLLATSGLVATQANSTGFALAGMACLLLGAAICLPAVLRGLLALLGRLAPQNAARTGWLLADSRWLLGPAALALMAMLLALVANNGLNTMIASFRDATDRWLDQRLAAQLYLRGGETALGSRGDAVKSWLADEAPEVRATVRFARELRTHQPDTNPVTIEVIDLAGEEPFRSSVELIRGSIDTIGAIDRFHGGEGVLISERAWRLNGWQPGDRVTVCDPQADLPVLGVYHDYGNPRSQWMLTPSQFRACWPREPFAGIALHGGKGTDWSGLQQRLLSAFDPARIAIVNQQTLKNAALTVFDRTFVVAQALNTLTLLVAGVGIFCAISAIHHHRIGQQALLASLGLSRSERAQLLLAQWGLIGLLCMVAVGPFGSALGWYLAAVVTPVAFGWSFPLRIELAPYLVLTGVACTALLLAVFIPSLQLLRVQPARLLRGDSL